MVCVLKSDELLLVYFKHFLHFEWRFDESALCKGNILRSPEFDMGGEKPSFLEFIAHDSNLFSLYFHYSKFVEDRHSELTISEKDYKPIYTFYKTIDASMTPDKIDMLPLGCLTLTSKPRPFIISGTIKASNLESFYNLSIKPKEDLCCNFKSILEQETDTDMVFKIDEEIIKAHKVVLKARSPVFRKMFSHNSSEALQNTIVVSDMKPITMRRFLRFLYTAEMEKCASTDELLELYYAADKYEVLSLRDCCKLELMNCVAVENACCLFTLAIRHSDEVLKKAVVDFVGANFNSVVNENQFMEMSKEDMALLVRSCSPVVAFS